MKPIKVLVVDDSALVRQVLSEGLGKDPAIEVVGAAPDPYVARDKIVKLKPDVMTLDVEMPRMDGIEFLRKLLPQWPLPVVMVSSVTQRGAQATLDALDAGAVDFVAKPGSQFGSGLGAMMGELCAKVKAASTVNVKRTEQRKNVPTAVKPTRVLKGSTDKVIAIGASTGGTEALREVISSFAADTPGVVVVQHMPEKFTQLYAERLNKQCAMEVREAKDGDRVMPGTVLIAPGGYQMRVSRRGGQYRVICKGQERESGHCPSVDVLFRSVATEVGCNAVGVILTGMGSDGADGLSKMRTAGAKTIGQDEDSCVVYGMPRAAFDRGAVEQQKSLSEIASTVIGALG